MSFSSEIKEEISKINNLSDKESIKAEFKGYLLTCNVNISKDGLIFKTENEYNINRFSKLLNNLNFNDYEIEIKGKNYLITVKNFYDIGFLYEIDETKEKNLKAIVRGAFLGSGSLNNPENKYHLEIILNSEENAKYIQKIIKSFNINGKILERKQGYSLYIKDGEEISKLLAFIGAGKSVLKFEEIRVVRETRNNVNRVVNCETANLNKIIDASMQQIKAIEYLKKMKAFENLSENLQEIAELRLENPDTSLIELGKMLKKPIGKSGVNHRLKKIQEIAEKLGNK